MSSFFNWLLLALCIGGAISLTLILWVQDNKRWEKAIRVLAFQLQPCLWVWWCLPVDCHFIGYMLLREVVQLLKLYRYEKCFCQFLIVMILHILLYYLSNVTLLTSI